MYESLRLKDEIEVTDGDDDDDQDEDDYHFSKEGMEVDYQKMKQDDSF